MTQQNESEDWILERDMANDYVHHDPLVVESGGLFQYQRVPILKHPTGTIRKRWCPTHRRHEDAVVGERLHCGPAWRDQYALEREVEAERMTPNAVMLKTAQSIEKLAEEISNGERVIAEPPTRPQAPPPGSPPPPAPPPRQRALGKGGVALP